MSAERAGQVLAPDLALPQPGPQSYSLGRNFQTYKMGGLLWMTTKAGSRSIFRQFASPLGPSVSISVLIKWGDTPAPARPPPQAKAWLGKSFSHQMPLAGTLSGSEWGWGNGGYRVSISHTALQRQEMRQWQFPNSCSVLGLKGQPLPTSHFLQAFPVTWRPRLAHPSPGLLKRVCPEGKMHGSRQQGSSEKLKRGWVWP